jgi:glucosamine kinase
MRDLILAIDGGGSKTQLYLIDRTGMVVHAGRSGGSNPVDNPHWQDAFVALAAPLEPFHKRIAASVIAVGGYRESTTLDILIDAAMAQIFPDLSPELDNDVFLAHDAAFLGRPGALLIAGTGSMLVARGHDGKSLRVGGWGHMVSDEGSGHWLGREALGLATRTLDGRAQALDLTGAVLEALDLPPAEGGAGIIDWLNRSRHLRSDIASLAPIVARLSEAGDPAAKCLLGAAIEHLAALVTAGRERSGLGPDGAWSLLGGLANLPQIRGGLADRLGPITPPALPPVGGAAWRAARKAGWAVDAAWLAAVKTGTGSRSEGV